MPPERLALLLLSSERFNPSGTVYFLLEPPLPSLLTVPPTLAIYIPLCRPLLPFLSPYHDPQHDWTPQNLCPFFNPSRFQTGPHFPTIYTMGPNVITKYESTLRQVVFLFPSRGWAYSYRITVHSPVAGSLGGTFRGAFSPNVVYFLLQASCACQTSATGCQPFRKDVQ